jgi:rhodanese-related sulfurtransferase
MIGALIRLKVVKPLGIKILDFSPHHGKTLIMNISAKLLVIVLSVLASSLAIAADSPTKETTQAKEAVKPAEHPYTAKSPKLNRRQFDVLLAKPDKLVLIDVRRPDEVGKLGGFPAYLSIQLADLDKYSAFIPKDRAIITVSNHAGRAGKAADLLAEKGFQVAGAVGSQNYEEEGGQLLKLEPPAKPVTEKPKP